MTTGSPLGDIVRAWHLLQPEDAEARAAIAAALGVDWSASRQSATPEVKRNDSPVTILVPPNPKSALPEAPRTLRDLSVDFERPASEADAAQILSGESMQIQRELAPFPEKPPLLNPKWTRGIFSSRLARPVESRRIDTPALIRSELRARPLTRLPWRRVYTMSSGVRCLIDTGAPLDIFLDDREQILRALRALAGFERVSVGFFETLPDSPDARIDPETKFAASPESPLLLLTDFGHYPQVGRRWALIEEWLAFLERERSRGTSRIVALTPLQPADWPTALLPEMEIVLWDWPTGVGKRRLDAR